MNDLTEVRCKKKLSRRGWLFGSKVYLIFNKSTFCQDSLKYKLQHTLLQYYFLHQDLHVTCNPKKHPTNYEHSKKNDSQKNQRFAKLKVVFCQRTCRDKNTTYNFARPHPCPPSPYE